MLNCLQLHDFGNLKLKFIYNVFDEYFRQNTYMQNNFLILHHQSMNANQKRKNYLLRLRR